MEDEASVSEVLRLSDSKKRAENTKARWENVYRMWEQGKTLAEIARWIGRSESTARQLLKRAAQERQKQPGFRWPVDRQGRKICDLPHPMPSTENASAWVHRRSIVWNRSMRLIYCPVCRHSYSEGRPLMEILT